MFLIVYLGSLFIGVVLIFGVIDYIVYLSKRHGENKISFKRFKNFYEINPKSWVLYDDKVCKNLKNSYFDIVFYFKHYRDLWKYRFFLRNIIKEKNRMKEIEDLNKLIESVKKDLKEFNNKNIYGDF